MGPFRHHGVGVDGGCSRDAGAFRPLTAITTRRQFCQRMRARHPEMLCNYDDHLAPHHYPLPLPHQVVEALRPQPSSVYCPGWTTLTHAGFSANHQQR
jgi:hypothetical protein